MDRTVLANRSYQMGKKLYVGNLANAVASSQLREWFTQYGTVLSARVIADRETDRSKGFGFVEMETDEQAQAAILGLNEHEHEGRILTVDEAKPRVARTSGTRQESGDSRPH
jgi:RNA recognition motif-containing protein